MTPKAKTAIAQLLKPGDSLADASTWADENRRKLPKTAPWHYVDVPLDEPRYHARFSGDVPTKGCIVDKIHEFQATLKDTARSVEDRRFALRFLVHLIEDLHMPLHVGENHDKGGNMTQVRFFDRGSNMHRLWAASRGQTYFQAASRGQTYFQVSLKIDSTPRCRLRSRTGLA